jgi:hypothetical protein
MIKITALVFSFLVFFGGSALAQTHAAHEHGVATLDLAVVSGGFEVGLDSPLANFISFEHVPSTEAQKAEVTDMVSKLAKAGDLFKAPTEAGCKVKTISFKSENIPAELFGQYAAKDGAAGHGHGHGHAEGDHDHGHDEGDHDHGHGHAEGDHEHGHDHDGDHEGEVHGDLEAAYVFECAEAGKLTGLEVGLFSVFPALEEVEARVVSDKGQSASELKAGNSSLKW